MLLITSKWDNIHRRNNWKLQRNSYSSCFIRIQSIFLKILSYITQLGILHILHITSWSGIFKLLYCFCYYLLYNLYTSQYQSRSKETTTCTYHHKKKTNQHFFLPQGGYYTLNLMWSNDCIWVISALHFH